MGEEQQRQTPMRGHGKRRQSVEEGNHHAAAEQPLLPSQPPQSQLREGGIRRKPVPSTVLEQDSPNRDSRISPTIARSSVARDIDREKDAPTPGVDDTPYIHFALDQLTRDEEVRGSRQYGIAPGLDGSYPYQVPANVQWPTQSHGGRYEQLAQEEDIVEQSPYNDEPPPKSPNRFNQPGKQEASSQSPNVFLPVSQEESRQPPLTFIPGTLRPLELGLLILLVLAYLVCLLIAAIWSRADTGLWDYRTIGDGRYFLFQYFPALLGMIVLVWMFEVQKAVYRIAPFIGMGAENASSARIVAAKLPIAPRGFVLPYFGHFRAKLPIIGSFLFIAWLQVFTIPLLGSSFNVHQNRQHVWRWIAVQGAIWTVIALYILLLAALIVLMVWLRRVNTGLKWDPRSLADMIVLLERSNALDGQGEGVPQLGYFRTTNRPNEVFHAYGIAEKPARSYAMVDGQLREKRYSNPDAQADVGNPPRLSKEPILPRDSAHTDEEAMQDHHHGSSALPWFLKPFFALLWPIVAVVLLLAFLIVSYLPSTTITKGFLPMLPSAVGTLGFSSGNFLFSFIPTLLAMLVLLFWMDIDNAYRILAPLEALAGTTSGAIAERSLLVSYTADLPGLATLSALFNGHYRQAFLSAITLLTIPLPILASGVFWAEFNLRRQHVLIYADMSGYYALTVFCTIHALAYLATFPPSSLRHTPIPTPNSLTNILSLLRDSRLLDDLAFHNPVSRTDLVTRLLSPRPGSALILPNPAAAASKVSVADSVRRLGRARAAAANNIPSHPVKYALGRFTGRDGSEFVGVDRVRVS